MCLETLQRIVEADGHPDSIPQEQLMTAGEELKPAPKLFKENCRIDWTQDAETIHNFVRGLSPVPGAWTMLVAPDGKETMLKIYKAHVGTSSKLVLTAGGGTQLAVDELQLAGKKRMKAADFLNGMKDFEKYSVR